MTGNADFSPVAESGKPIVVAESTDYVDGVERRQSVEVRLTILR